MKTLKEDELYQNLQEFLKKKGVELKDGSYAQKIQKSCGLLSDAINTSQKSVARAKTEIDKKLDQLRQVIHEKTAPRGASPKSQTTPPPSQDAASKQTSGTKSAGKPKKPRTRNKH